MYTSLCQKLKEEKSGTVPYPDPNCTAQRKFVT
jgi:hypothetical protein